MREQNQSRIDQNNSTIIQKIIKGKKQSKRLISED